MSVDKVSLNGSVDKTKKTAEKPKSQEGSLEVEVKKGVELSQETYGTYYDSSGNAIEVLKFTWKNHNNIEVQAITYGARIVSIKYPNKWGVVDDVVLGFDSLKHYLGERRYHFGALLGRCAGPIENATFAANERQHWLSKNKDPHHLDGGFSGFDDKIWQAHVDGKRVRMSYTSSHKEEGYPGTVMIRATYELSARNEFRIDIEAFTTSPTIINITNALYFNLAGHHAGPEEMGKHELTVNANCYTVNGPEGLPTGEIKNVYRTSFDFQVPQVLGLTIAKYSAGYNQNLCVNKGSRQEYCFVARLLHPRGGRMVEIYSNQPGVNVYTANDFGHGYQVRKSSKELERDQATIFGLVKFLHEKIAPVMWEDEKVHYDKINELIKKIRKRKTSTKDEDVFSVDVDSEFALDPIQLKYLESIRDAAFTMTTPEYISLGQVIQKIINTSLIRSPLEYPTEDRQPEKKSKQEILEEIQKQEEEIHRKMVDEELKRKGLVRMENKPIVQKEQRLIGKGGAVYKTHGAICIQTQNYPNAINHKNFPDCTLTPAGNYKHTIIYKFWVKPGDACRWTRRIDRKLRKH